MLSRAAVSEVIERLWAEYEDFATHDLAEFSVVCLFMDGIAGRLRASQPRKAVLCAWGICADGTNEDTETCRAFFQDLRRKGLFDPLLVATDGAPGLIRTVEECFPRSHRPRCLAHRSRNL